MPHDVLQHPSNISRATANFLATATMPAEALRLYHRIISLFIKILQSDPSTANEGTGGECLLRDDRDAYNAKTISNFVDHHLQSLAALILQPWIIWCYDHIPIHLRDFHQANTGDRSAGTRIEPSPRQAARNALAIAVHGNRAVGK